MIDTDWPAVSGVVHAGFGLLDETGKYVPTVLIPLLIHAVGVALIFAPGAVAIMEGVPDEHAGAASGLLQMDQQIGGTLGIAIIASAYAVGSRPEQFVPGLSGAFFAAAAIASLAAVIAWAGVKRVPKSGRSQGLG